MKKIILVLSALVLMFQFSFPVILNVPGTYSTIQEGIKRVIKEFESKHIKDKKLADKQEFFKTLLPQEKHSQSKTD